MLGGAEGGSLLSSSPGGSRSNLAILSGSRQGSYNTEAPSGWARGGRGPWVTRAPLLQCWENAVGEELYKLSIFNFLLTVAFAFFVSLPRR